MHNNKRFNLKKVALSCLVACSVNMPAVAADWADDWLVSNASFTGPSTYNSGSRNYMSMGNLQFRANTSVSYPITMQAPRMKGGCGGVDIFLGGMSFMDVDMLVDKFEQMIQNGEVIAFQLAIKALSEKLGVTVESIQNVMDMLNGLQLDSCAMSKAAVTTIWDGGSVNEAAKEVWSEISQGQELSIAAVKNAWEKGKNDDASKGRASASTNIKQEIAACPQEVKDVLSVDGSIIERVATLYGMADYSDFLRGYVGDVYTYHDAANGNMPMAKKISSCSQNEKLGIDDLVYGRSFEKRPAVGINDPYTEVGAGCSQNVDSVNLVDYSEEKLNELATALADPSAPIAPTSALYRWANNAPMSVMAAMKLSNDAGITGEVIGEMSETLAYAYAFRIFDDMYRNSFYMFSTLNDKLSNATSDAVEEASSTAPGVAAPQCNLKAYMVTINELNQLQDEIWEVHKQVKESYQRQLAQMQAHISIINRYQQIESRRFGNAGIARTR